MKTKGETLIPEPFELTEKTLVWLNKKYPQVDLEDTKERFEDWAKQVGAMYADWQAGFKTVVRKGMDNGWRSIVTLKGGREFDPQWIPLLVESRRLGIPEPMTVDSPGTFKTKIENWKRSQSRAPTVVNFTGVIRKAV